jgi:lipopolysaccharide heptosyltransferase III
MTWELDGKPLHRILITRLRYLGDIAMSSVVWRALKQGDPDLHIGYLCEDTHAPLLQGEPDLDRLHVLNVKRRGADAAARGTHRHEITGAGTAGTILQLRRARYDLAVDLFFNPRSAWLLRLAGIGKRICGPAGGRTRLYTHCAVVDQADQAFTLAAPGGLGEHLSRLLPLRHSESGLNFRDWLLQEFPEALQPRLADPQWRKAAESANGILLIPGATWPTKQWPIEHWRALLDLLADGPDEIRILSSPAELNPAAQLAMTDLPPKVRVLPVLSLRDALSEVARASAVITVDGGLMHCAVALGKPVVGLFGPTSPAIWFPYAGDQRFKVLSTAPQCHPCDKLHCDAFICLPDLQPEVVARSLQDVRNSGVGPC